MPFSKRMTMLVAALAGLVAFLITAFHFFSGIYEFHGTWLEFSGYLMDGLGESMVNGIFVLCICGLIATPLVSLIEYRVIQSLRTPRPEPQKKAGNP